MIEKYDIDWKRGVKAEKLINGGYAIIMFNKENKKLIIHLSTKDERIANKIAENISGIQFD
jgi:hypothetical protein